MSNIVTPHSDKNAVAFVEWFKEMLDRAENLGIKLEPINSDEWRKIDR